MTTRKRRIRQEWVRNLARPQVREGVKLAAQTQSGEGGSGGDVTEADLFIYDVIDGWGGDWGVSAMEVVDLLNAYDGDVLNVRLNSPGGDYFEGVAILNALQRHPATVNVYVDGMAASAASVIAMAGEKRVMGLGAQLMIHEASTVAIGTAEDMLKTAAMLEQTNGDIAALYAACVKDGDAAAFRTQMAAETWFTASSAMECGLATELAKKAEPDDDEVDESECDCGKDSCDECSGQGEKAPPFKKKNEAAALVEEIRVAAVLLAEIRAEAAVSRETAPQSPAGTPPAEPPAPLPSAGINWSEALVSALTERRSL